MPYDDKNRYVKTADIEGKDNSGGGSADDRTPFRRKGHQIQQEMVKGERRFGEVSGVDRITEPPPEENLENNYSEEAEMAATASNEIQGHEWLNCQAMDGRDPVRDRVRPTGEDVLDYARNNPEARLTLQPAMKMALENAERYKYSRSSTPTPRPAGM